MTDLIVEREAGLAAGDRRRGAPVSWSAVFAGSAAALALGVALTTVASGFGLELGSPGATSRGSLAAFTPELGGLSMGVQVVCGALGGFLAGRLRAPWTGLHGDETHFRDTAHGLLAWAVSTLAGVVLAVAVLAPYAAGLAPAAAEAASRLTAAEAQVQAERAGHIAAQAGLFTGVGMLLSAFAACAAAALGGLHTDDMHARR